MARVRALILLIMLIFTGGCGLFDSTSQVTVGVNIPLSGEYAQYGKMLLTGIKLKCNEINAAGGINGKQIRLAVKDNESTSLGTADAAASLASWNKVPIIIGAYSSINTFAMRPEAEKYNIPVITPTGTADILSVRNPYIFRATFTDSTQGKAIGMYAYHRERLRNIGILVDANENGRQSRHLGQAAKDAFTECGGKVSIYAGYYSHEISFNQQISRMMQLNVDGIFVPATQVVDAARFIREARMMGYQGMIFGSDGWDEEEIYTKCGPTPGKCFYFGMFASDYNRPDVQAFVAKIFEETGKVAATCEAQGYDTMGLVAEAIRRGGSESSDIMAALAEIKNYPGVGGTITIMPDRNTDKQIFIKEIYIDQTGSANSRLMSIISPFDVRKIYDVPRQKSN